MTREEAIDIIKCLAWHTRPNEEDVEQAIKALEQCEVWNGIHGQVVAPKCTFDRIWNEAEKEEQEPTTKYNLAHNLCESCTNIGCEFQSGIVRTKCAFYMTQQPHIEPDNCGNYVIMQPTVEAMTKSDYENRLKADMVAMLDKIRAEIEQLRLHKAQFLTSDNKVCIDSQEVLDIIDKYKAEGDKE